MILIEDITSAQIELILTIVAAVCTFLHRTDLNFGRTINKHKELQV
ncbi:hypothetical protein M2480_002907 [Parabacteroides sp. PFB2-12]|nr:hypothetical protein [Parabacteroides sp. PM6-13]MDH6391904.1 hypothetical protein [Parabacteroides sp. PFB2-12]